MHIADIYLVFVTIKITNVKLDMTINIPPGNFVVHDLFAYLRNIELHAYTCYYHSRLVSYTLLLAKGVAYQTPMISFMNSFQFIKFALNGVSITIYVNSLVCMVQIVHQLMVPRRI